ncbi:LLM class flavin-dependent oxidoreductase [Brevibacterium daeguense]|uniref:LLM class flavin-dependent oxidoreductase n=1 Tax=Brevibacterium daeguense TaxID=909936 RepID=A0ABP8EJ14_9MICO|nr:NtaA/DmoA family FMN-dependent monooxygenase [Brevibacterium daeguense]
MPSRREAHFTLFLTPSGYHESAWLVQDDDPCEAISVESLHRAAATAERGKLDAVFFPDWPMLSHFRAEYFPQVRYDPITLMSALGAANRKIGWIASASTTYNEPFDLARRLATADFVTNGRAGWNVVTTYHAEAAKNFGRTHPAHGDRYARAAEFVEVTRRLWDSWEDDAIVGDRSRGRWADIDRIRPARFEGAHFSVEGALPVPRAPQGHPVLAQAGSSPAGIDLAGRIAELVFTPQSSPDAGLGFRQKLDAAARRYGRTADDIRILPGLAFVLGSTEEEAQRLRAELEESASPELRWKNLALNAGLDHQRIDPGKPLDPRLAEEAEKTTFAQHIISAALSSDRPFIDLAQEITGLPGGLEFTGTPEQLADLIEDWVLSGASDGFTLQPTTIPTALDAFVDHVVPILQRRELFRTEYSGTTLREHLGLAAVRV